MNGATGPTGNYTGLISHSGITVNNSGSINLSTVTTVNIVSTGSGYIHSPTITSVGTGANGSIGYNQSLTGSTGATGYQRNCLFSINDINNNEIFKIDNNGVLTYNGPPGKAAKSFIKLLSYYIDKETVSNAALARSYKRGVEKCLRQIKSMSKEEFIALLEKEIDNRTCNEMLLYLKESPEETEEN